MKLVRRIGPDPHVGSIGPGGPLEPKPPPETPAARGCPDLWELDSGDVAIIGLDHTASLVSQLDSASCGPDEQIVVVPRCIFDAAAQDWISGSAP